MPAAQREASREVYKELVTDAARQHASATTDADRQKIEADLEKKLQDAKLGEAIPMEKAQALLKREELAKDETLRNYSSYASSQTKAALRRALGAASGIAAGAATTVAAAATAAAGTAGKAAAAATPSGAKERRTRRASIAETIGSIGQTEAERRAAAGIEPPRPGQRPPQPRPNAPPVVGNDGSPTAGGGGNTGQT